MTGSLLEFRNTKAVEDDCTKVNVGKKDSREEKVKESVATTDRDNINENIYIPRAEKVKESMVASTNRDNINKKDSREEMGKTSVVAGTKKMNKKVDSGNTLARKQKGPIVHVTATGRSNDETPSNTESWLRSGVKKPEHVSKASLTSMWNKAKQEMNQENEKTVKGRGRSDKQIMLDNSSGIKHEHVLLEPISELQPNFEHKKCRVHNGKIDGGARDLNDSKEDERMDIDNVKNDYEKDETTKIKTRINYVGEVYIDTSDLPKYYTFVKELNKNGEDGYICDVCYMTFIGPEDDKKRIERHVVTHSKEKRTHKCDTCKKTFTQKSDLINSFRHTTIQMSSV